MAIYSKTSPYYTTVENNGYLDVMTFRNISVESDDILFEILKKYEYRPDLLAFDLYNDVNLWWVFAARNQDRIKDPIFDMIPGKKIYLPKLSSIKKSLGI